MLRLSAVCASLLLALSLLVSTGESQDKDKKEKAKGFLPPGFKDLNLSAEQKSKVYGIQADFKAKIVELEKKAKDLKNQEHKDVFAVLTDDQRAKYLKTKGVEVPAKDKTGDKK
ncbi:MAG: hypothetical protein EXS16_15630 [Gemmataceae bacterium]|nr:hypothetical protein [Gemmataceae bacterium]